MFGLIVHDIGLATPDPVANINQDWMLEQLITPGTSPSAFLDGTSILYGETIDNRSRRRIREIGDTLFFTIHNDGSANMSYSFFAKVLVALP